MSIIVQNRPEAYKTNILKGDLHPEMPDILFFFKSRYFYKLNFKYMHIHS